MNTPGWLNVMLKKGKVASTLKVQIYKRIEKNVSLTHLYTRKNDAMTIKSPFIISSIL